jgi:hypothetical protein
MEAVKYITGRWQQIKAPKMWHLLTADNQVKEEKFRRRSYYFEKLISWSFGISWLDIGRRYRRYTARRLMRELDFMEKQEARGTSRIKLPFIWRWI